MPQNLGTLIPFVLIVLVFWFLVIRPARKRQQEMSSVQSSVSTGAEVMLGSGIYGTVTGVEDDSVRLEVSPGTVIRVARQAVVRVVTPAPTEPGAGMLPGEEEPPGRPSTSDTEPGEGSAPDRRDEQD